MANPVVLSKKEHAARRQALEKAALVSALPPLVSEHASLHAEIARLRQLLGVTGARLAQARAERDRARAALARGETEAPDA
jgi:hypothetical protein